MSNNKSKNKSTHPYTMLFLIMSTIIVSLAEVSFIQGAMVNPVWVPFAIFNGVFNIVLIGITIYAYKRY